MKKVLVIVDMQNDFIDGALGSAEAQAIVPNAVQKILDFNGDVFVTQDTHDENYLNTQEGKKLPVVHCIKGTHGWELNSDIEKALSGREYTVVEKTTFGSMFLADIIIDGCGKDVEIEMFGLCTDICVVSNAMLLKAKLPEVKITVDSTCSAGVTPDLHKAALDTMRSCQIDII